ncbi:MAG: Biotin carboxyl carrier protein of acetyl-CoA carboxylase [Chlamydiales bacterium]|nr:Biotin carboxyl carrier protein of acetyl-CoA carboxylase [Chlamydiales bacterium]
MDLKQIEKLMVAMERSSIKRVALKREGFEIELERESAFGPPPPAIEVQREVVERHPPSPHQKEVKEVAASGVFVTSPMVGTYYDSPSPDDPTFIKVGDQVEEDTVLCIIEAMKVMNEVKAGMRGRIAEVLVNNGDPVEFGSNIFRIET